MKKIFLTCTFLAFIVANLFSQTATAPASGDGSVGNPYQIASIENLRWIYEDNTRWSLYYNQTAHIDASTTGVGGTYG